MSANFKYFWPKYTYIKPNYAMVCEVADSYPGKI